MMRKGRDLIGTAVVSQDTGRRLARIRDLIFDQERNEVLAFVLEERGLFTNAHILPLQDIKAIGRDAIIISSEKAIVRSSTMPAVDKILQHDNVLIDTKLITMDGRYIGVLTDLYFDEESGEVEGFELSGGVFPDGYSGRAFVPALRTIAIGDEIALAPPEILQWMTEQASLPEGAIEEISLDDTLSDRTVDPAAQKALIVGRRADRDVLTPDSDLLVARDEPVSEWAVEEAERLGILDDLYAATGSNPEPIPAHERSVVPNLTVTRAKGRRAHHAVETTDGNLVVATGQVVTQRVIDRARRSNKEAELLEAVGLRAGEEMRRVEGVLTTINERLETGSERAGYRFREGVERSQNEASELWTRLRRRLELNRKEREQAQLDSHIRRAVGRPVTRVLLNRQDQVILNVGELITFDAIRQAKEAGVLDILLDSVYEKAPDAAILERYAPSSGKAALKQDDASRTETIKR